MRSALRLLGACFALHLRREDPLDDIPRAAVFLFRDRLDPIVDFRRQAQAERLRGADVIRHAVNIIPRRLLDYPAVTHKSCMTG